MVYQIAEVSRSLTAVIATFDAGNWVVYTSEGVFILDCHTGGRTYLQRNGGIYEIDLCVREENWGPGNQAKGLAREGR